MNHTILATTAMMMSLCASAPAKAGPAQIFVATTGNDTNPGTLEKPFATLQRAQQAARKAAGREAVTVLVREGTYYLPETLVFTAEDSGTKAAPVVYQAYQKEQPVISGGVRLNDLKWEPYKDGILQAKVPAGFATDQLFVNGERQPMARYPNFDPKERHFNGWAADAFSPERAARWKDPPAGSSMPCMPPSGVACIMSSPARARTTRSPMKAAGRTTGRWACTTAVSWRTSSRNWMRPASGSWIARTALLYFYPPAGVDLATATIEAVRLKHLIEFRGTEQAPVRFVS